MQNSSKVPEIAEVELEKFLENQEYETLEAELLHVTRKAFLTGYHLGLNATTSQSLPQQDEQTPA